MLKQIFQRSYNGVAQFVRGQSRRAKRLRTARNTVGWLNGRHELLEKRLAMAIDVFTVPISSTAQNWSVVVASEGDDVFLQHAATPTDDLFIADNSSFLNRVAEIPGFNDTYDDLIVSQGEVINLSGASSGGAVWNTYPYAPENNNDELEFNIPLDDIDYSSPLSATLRINQDEYVISAANVNGLLEFTSPNLGLLEGTLTEYMAQSFGRLRLAHPNFAGLSSSDDVKLSSVTVERVGGDFKTFQE